MTNTNSVRRYGMTLIEIMIAILILSIGLLGVLAAVPFGAMQMNKMVEKDFVANTAKNAHQIIATNGWLQPTDWKIQKNAHSAIGAEYSAKGVSVGTGDIEKTFYDFTFPVLIDPRGYADFPFALETEVSERFISLSPWNTSGKSDLTERGINPAVNVVFPDCSYLIDPTLDQNPYDRLFSSTDDIVYDREDNSTNRPVVVTEDGQTAFTGEYSWMAMITPMGTGTDNPFNKLMFPADDSSKIVDVRSDVVIFRGRALDAGDYIRAQALITGGGYAGGTVELQLPVRRGELGEEETSVAELEENLKSSTHLLLIGPSDGDDPSVSTDDKQYFSSWYKIAGVGSRTHDNSGNTIGIEATLIGATCPAEWNTVFQNGNSGINADYVQAVVFKNVRGVSTETTRLTGN